MHDQRTLHDYWLALYMRKKFIIAVSLSAVIFAVGISLILPPVYEAKTSFYLPANLIAPSYTSEVSQNKLAQRPLMPSIDEVVLGFHIGVLKSNDIIEKLVALFPQKPRRFFSKNVDIVASPEQTILIYVRDEDPELAAEIANVYPGLFKEFHQHTIAANAGHTEKVLEYQLKQLEETYRERIRQLEEHLQENSLLSVSDTQARLAEQASEIERESNMNNIELTATERRIQSLKEKLEEEQSIYSKNESVLSSPQIDQLTTKVLEFEIAMASNPLAIVKSKLQKTRILLQREIDQLVKSTSKRPDSIYESLRESLIKEVTQLKYLSARQTALAGTQKKISQLISDSATRISELELLNKEKQVIENLQINVKKNLAEARIQKEFPTVEVVQVQTAVAPSTPVFPKVFLNGIVAALFGFAVGCYYALFLEYLSSLKRVAIRRNLDESLLHELT